MLGDTAVVPIFFGLFFFLLGAFLSQGIESFGNSVRGILHLFLRLTRINPNAGMDEYSEDEIMAMVDMGEEIGNIEQNEKELIENVFEFNNSTAEDIMVHRTDMEFLWSDISLQDITEEARAELYRAQAEKYRKEAEG